MLGERESVMDCRERSMVSFCLCSSRGELLGSSAAVFIEYELRVLRVTSVQETSLSNINPRSY